MPRGEGRNSFERAAWQDGDAPCDTPAMLSRGAALRRPRECEVNSGLGWWGGGRPCLRAARVLRGCGLSRARVLCVSWGSTSAVSRTLHAPRLGLEALEGRLQELHAGLLMTKMMMMTMMMMMRMTMMMRTVLLMMMLLMMMVTMAFIMAMASRGHPASLPREPPPGASRGSLPRQAPVGGPRGEALGGGPTVFVPCCAVVFPCVCAQGPHRN